MGEQNKKYLDTLKAMSNLAPDHNLTRLVMGSVIEVQDETVKAWERVVTQPVSQLTLSERPKAEFASSPALAPGMLFMIVDSYCDVIPPSGKAYRDQVHSVRIL